MQTLNLPLVEIPGMDVAWGAGSLFAIAVSGLLQPIFAAASMLISSVFIIVHSRRLRSMRLNRFPE